MIIQLSSSFLTKYKELLIKVSTKQSLKQQNAFVSDSFIIPVYENKERDINEFKKLIETSMYIQDIQQKHEYTLKGKYFLITTNTDYKKSLIEAKDMVNYIYPQRTTKELNLSNQRNNTSIIHTNLSTYTQALVQFHESNLVPETSSHKRLKL